MVEVIDVSLREGHFYAPILVEADESLIGNFLFLVLGLEGLVGKLLLGLPVS